MLGKSLGRKLIKKISSNISTKSLSQKKIETQNKEALARAPQNLKSTNKLIVEKSN